eukprot:1159562-Pelagomonas_calceolata.AAC.3
MCAALKQPFKLCLVGCCRAAHTCLYTAHPVASTDACAQVLSSCKRMIDSAHERRYSGICMRWRIKAGQGSPGQCRHKL